MSLKINTKNKTKKRWEGNPDETRLEEAEVGLQYAGQRRVLPVKDVRLQQLQQPQNMGEQQQQVPMSHLPNGQLCSATQHCRQQG